MRFLPDKGKRTVLTTEQINDLHRLYWSRHWPIRKIERHLRMGWHTIRNISMRRRAITSARATWRSRDSIRKTAEDEQCSEAAGNRSFLIVHLN
jgi:hypothetical protein